MDFSMNYCRTCLRCEFDSHHSKVSIIAVVLLVRKPKYFSTPLKLRLTKQSKKPQFTSQTVFELSQASFHTQYFQQPCTEVVISTFILIYNVITSAVAYGEQHYHLI